MKTLYLDIFSGISGDMFLGAMIDLGVDFQQLQDELAKLDLHEYHLHATRQTKANIEGTKFDVHLSHSHSHSHSHDHDHPHDHDHSHEHPQSHSPEHAHSHEHPHEPHSHSHSHSHSPHQHSHSHSHAEHRDFAQIKQLIERSSLSEWVKQKAIAVFQRVAIAEGKIHGQPPEKVHFHEVGAIDSIIDIAGACVALEMLGKPRVLAAAPVEGTGWVLCAHGRFPVPTAATLEILGARGIPLTQCDEPHELITPTGAALLAEFVEQFGPMQGLAASKIGYGLGTRNNRTRPNVLRAVLDESGQTATAQLQTQSSPALDWETDFVAVLETNLDDTHPELLGHFLERVLRAGVLDAYHTPAQMKKNRPGVLLTVLCTQADADRVSEIILRETTAFGVRRTLAERRKLRREFAEVETPYGRVTIKLGKLGGKVLHASPEFESCKQAAEAAQVTVKQVYEAAQRAWQE